MSAELQIREGLRLVNGEEPLDSLDLDDEIILDNKVHPVSAVQTHAFVCDRKGHLSPRGDLVLRQLQGEALFVR